MTTATLSEVSAAVTKAFNAGSVGEEYKGIMPAAYDAGTAWATEVSRDWKPASEQPGYLTSLLKTAEIGYTEGKEGKPLRGTDYFGESDIVMTVLLAQANRNVYVQAHETGKAGSAAADTGKTNWTPWLIGAGVLAAVGIGAVVLTSKENPSYKTSDPKGWGGDPTRGAALGRPTIHGPGDFSGKLTLRRIRLDSGGYDSNGTYFGFGAPLFWVSTDEADIDFMLRARDREAAKAEVLKQYPNAKFYR